MTVKEQPITSASPSPFPFSIPESFATRAAAVVVWLVGVLCTKQVTGQLVGSLLLAWPVALVGQFLLTKAESPIWRRHYWVEDENNPTRYIRTRRPIRFISILALVVDDAVNVAGAWILVKQLHTLPPFPQLGEMFGTQIPEITGGWALALCAIIGLGVSAAPEILWYQEE